MGNARFSEDFKRDAVDQITVRGYPVAEVKSRNTGLPFMRHSQKRSGEINFNSGHDIFEVQLC